MLAAVLNSPNYLSPDRGAEGRDALIERYDYVLEGMVSMGNARLRPRPTSTTAQLPKVGKPRTSNMYGGQRGFMLTMVKDELVRLGFDETADRRRRAPGGDDLHPQGDAGGRAAAYSRNARRD